MPIPIFFCFIASLFMALVNVLVLVIASPDDPTANIVSMVFCLLCAGFSLVMGLVTGPRR